MYFLRWKIYLACCLAIPMMLIAFQLKAEGVQTGVVFGRVVDEQNLTLPDVQVRLVGPQSSREVVTDEEGRFRFPQLPIGNYQLVAELLGLRAEQRDVRVYIGKTTEVELRLLEGHGSAEEPTSMPQEMTRDQIQVLAVAPLIDRFETGVRTSVSRQFLEELPVERFYQSVALLLPGVAGGEDGNPNTSGSLRSNNLFLIDGVDTTDPTTGLFGLNLSYDSVEDVDVTTAAPGVDNGRVSGAVINVVTSSGDHQFRGSARLFADNADWTGDYRAAPGLDREVAAANSRSGDVDNTFAASLSGPVIQDSLWFYGVFEDSNESFLKPTFEGTIWDEDANISSNAFKLNWQLGNASMVGQYAGDDAAFSVYSPFNRNPGENRAARVPSQLDQEFVLPFAGDVFAVERRMQNGEFARLEWSGVAGQNLAWTARAATQDRTLERAPANRRAHVAPHFAGTRIEADESFLIEDDFALFNGITDQGDENRKRRQLNLSANQFLSRGAIDHELNVGLDFQSTESDQWLTAGGASGVDRLTGRAVDGQVFFDRDFRDACFFELDCVPFDAESGDFQPFVMLNFWQRPRRSTTQDTVAVHFSDSITLGRWVLDAGIRYERVTAEDDSGRALVEDDSISPRLAVKYDATGDGSLLLSAVYSQFVEPFPQRLLDDFVRFETFSGYTEYFWADVFSNPQCEFEDPRNLNSPCWEPTAVEELFTFQPASPNLNLNRSSVEEIVLGFERRLTSHTSLRLHWIDRTWKDLWDDTFELSDDPDNDFGIDAEVVNLPQAERSYRGFQLLVQRRFADRWQLLGSYTWSETKGNLFRSTGRDSFVDFSRITDLNLVNRSGFAPYDRTNQLKLFATYRIPLGASALSIGSALRYEDGAPYQAERFEDFGIRFLNPRGSLRLDDFTQLDLSLAFDFPVLSGMDLGLKLEIFNLSDEQTILGVETDVDSVRFEQPLELSNVQNPRSFRLTLGFHF